MAFSENVTELLADYNQALPHCLANFDSLMYILVQVSSCYIKRGIQYTQGNMTYYNIVIGLLLLF